MSIKWRERKREIVFQRMHGAPPGKVQTDDVRGYGCPMFSYKAARYPLLQITKYILCWETTRLELTTPKDEKGKRDCLGGKY